MPPLRTIQSVKVRSTDFRGLDALEPGTSRREENWESGRYNKIVKWLSKRDSVALHLAQSRAGRDPEDLEILEWRSANPIQQMEGLVGLCDSTSAHPNEAPIASTEQESVMMLHSTADRVNKHELSALSG